MISESSIQGKIIKHGKKNGWIMIKTIVLSENGYPDIFCFKNGITIFVEVKNETNKLSELQKVRQEQLKSQGFICEVARSLEEFKKLIAKVLFI
jgi:Holliday junction resolvase-like predicted endonuclease